MGGANSWIFLIIGIFAYLFNRAYTHYGSMESPNSIWNWAVFLYKGKYFGVTNICLALTYLSIGTFFSKTEYKSSKLLNVCLVALGMLMMHIESHKDVALGVPVIAFGLFPLVKNWSVDSSWLSFRWFRKMSTLIYFIHAIVIVGIHQMFSDMSELLIWGVVVLYCIIISATLLKLSKMRNLRWISKLY